MEPVPTSLPPAPAPVPRYVPLGLRMAHRSAELLGKGFSVETMRLADAVRDQVCEQIEQRATFAQLRARSATFELPKMFYDEQFRHALADLLTADGLHCRWVTCCERAHIEVCRCATTQSLIVSW